MGYRVNNEIIREEMCARSGVEIENVKEKWKNNVERMAQGRIPKMDMNYQPEEKTVAVV